MVVRAPVKKAEDVILKGAPVKQDKPLKKSGVFSITMPLELVRKIDEVRGSRYTTRSRFILEAVRKYLNEYGYD